ncbi:MAG: hypothetical protein EG822_02660 [Deltaproteobacteria bacterium]|nr:hypothetical protein [Deltaproteobacteria bacterium]TLN02014.1 MAG: hypothetical protein FDZ73_13645 [bacterium]
MKIYLRMVLLLCVFFSLAGCAARVAVPQKAATLSTSPQLTPRGTMIFNGEYEFVPPPSEWEMLRGSQFTHYVVGFYRRDLDKSRLASSFIAYDEDPYGTSKDLETRAQECLKRYFWASMLQKNILEKKKRKVLGGEGLSLTFEINDPAKKIKVRSMLVFGYRGERVVLFYLNQWRSIDGSFDPSAFELFDKFITSFTFLKKSFYETL